MSTAHAKLSASGSNRWMNCPPSIVFEAQFPEPAATPFAGRGTLGHNILANKIYAYLGLQEQELPQKLLQHDSPELREQVEIAFQFLIELIEKVKAETNSPTIAVEQQVDFSKWVPEGFGTADLLIIADGTAHVIDLKLGQIRVVAQGNSQLRLYSVGVLNTFGSLYEIDQIEMIILQPPLNNISRETLTTTELLEWAENVLAPKAKLAWAGEGEFNPGDHCRWCRGKAQCPARNESNLALARHDFAEPASMTDLEIAEVLAQAQKLYVWVRNLEEYAYSQALNGRQWPGFKLVEARGSRKFTDVTAAAQALIDAGVSNADVFESNLRSLTALENKLGKNKFVQLLGDLVVKTPGKPTLVPVTDKRSEFHPLAAAAADFID